MSVKRVFITLCIVLPVLLLSVLAPIASAGDEPLSLEKSSIADGQKDVPLDASIELLFTNNVVNQSVAKNNASCIKLYQSSNEVPVDVVMADDQLQPEKKRVITVVPKQQLQKGMQYRLVISKDMTAKNGISIGKETTIAFTTQGAVSYTWYIIGGVALVFLAAAVIILKRKRI